MLGVELQVYPGITGERDGSANVIRYNRQAGASFGGRPQMSRFSWIESAFHSLDGG